jgi:hypothetical protein
METTIPAFLGDFAISVSYERPDNPGQIGCNETPWMLGGMITE